MEIKGLFELHAQFITEIFSIISLFLWALNWKIWCVLFFFFFKCVPAQHEVFELGDSDPITHHVSVGGKERESEHINSCGLLFV